MSSNRLIDVLASGAVILGPDVTCDGFHSSRSLRVQSHVHQDHMKDFSTSLSGDVLLTRPTRMLLERQYPALDICTNVHVVEYGESWHTSDADVELVSSNHMLGAAQVKVTLPDGTTVGYSGDFGWPLDEVIQVDALVVDATYGKPDSGRPYTQQQAQADLSELITQVLRQGPVHMLADTGPVERALQVLMMNDVLEGVPVIGSQKLAASIRVHRDCGYHLPDVLVEGTESARTAIQTGRFLRLWSLYSREINDGLYPGAVVKLTKFRTRDQPIERSGESSYIVGFSNHADFNGTMEYIKATGASIVVTDNLRGGAGDRASVLANMVEHQLGIAACVSSNHYSHAWGE